jgi:hypothetical protein
VALVRTDVLEERIASIKKVKKSANKLNWLVVTVNVVPSTPILVALMIGWMYFFETSLLTRGARRHLQEDGIRQSHCRENLKSNITLTGWAL